MKLFSCKSTCSFNEEPVDLNLNRMSLNQFELKYKDLEKLHRILSKRKRIQPSSKIEELI